MAKKPEKPIVDRKPAEPKPAPKKRGDGLKKLAKSLHKRFR